MKRELILLLFILILSNSLNSLDRYSKKVDNVLTEKRHEFIILPGEEEPKGDQTLPNIFECDIIGASSCYDDKYIQLTILISHYITYKFKIFYAVKFINTNGIEEWYICYPNSKKFIYEKIENGLIIETTDLTGVSSGDSGFSSYPSFEVVFIINKDEHFKGEKGKLYYIQTQFISGVLDSNNMRHITDETIEIKMFYRK